MAGRGAYFYEGSARQNEELRYTGSKKAPMSHQRDVRAFSCISNGMVRVSAAIRLGRRGHNSPQVHASGIWLKLQCTKQDVTPPPQFPTLMPILSCQLTPIVRRQSSKSMIHRLIVICAVTNCRPYQLLHKLKKPVVHSVSQIERVLGERTILL